MIRDIIRLIRSFSQKERYLFYGAAVVFLVTLIASITGGIYSSTKLEPAPGGEYTEGVVGQPTAINPILAGGSEVDRDLIRTMFADLISLSQSYSTSSAGKVWSVKLKQDLQWSDGQPLTAGDAVFTLNMIQNPDSGSPLSESWRGITVDRISDLEVRFTLKSPYAFFLDNLKGFYPAPEHIFKNVPAANLHLSDYNLEPVSSGPYKFVSYEKQKSGLISAYHLEKNSFFSGSAPLIDRLNFTFFTNYNDALLSFNNKNIDGLGGFDSAAADELKINHQTRELDLPRYYAVFFNPNNNPALKDRATREALALATDKDQLVKDILSGYGSAANGPLSPNLDGYAGDVYAQEHFSIAEAAVLLEKNKWKKDDQGVYVRAAGKSTERLKFELVTPEIPFLVATANNLKANWAKLGADVTVTVEPSQKIQEERIKSRNYEALLFGNVLRNSDLYSFWHSGQRFNPGLNLASYQNAAVDGLLDSIRKNFNPVKRAGDLKKVQQAINADRPAIFLFSPRYLYAGPKNLGGFTETFLLSPADRFSNVSNWFLRTNRVFK